MVPVRHVQAPQTTLVSSLSSSVKSQKIASWQKSCSNRRLELEMESRKLRFGSYNTSRYSLMSTTGLTYDDQERDACLDDTRPRHVCTTANCGDILQGGLDFYKKMQDHPADYVLHNHCVSHVDVLPLYGHTSAYAVPSNEE